MAIKNKLSNNKIGFTIMELLVVIAIISMLVAVLVPGVQGVKRLAKNLEQKSMFHALEIGLEVYRKDFGDFPESKTESHTGGAEELFFTGAQHLAEAMVGRDSLGYEPSQIRDWDGPWEMPSDPIDLYNGISDASKARRKPAYLNLKDTDAFLPGELFGADSTAPSAGSVVSFINNNRAPVLTDMFFKKKVTVDSTSVKVGSPILYYKANRRSETFKKAPTEEDVTAGFKTWIYDYGDNAAIIDLKSLDGEPHKLTPGKFYESINNDKLPQNAYPNGWPMNQDTYILISAGYDGIYGTKDDVTNIKNK